MNTYKVYGGYTFIKGKQVRAIVATTNKRKAIELLGVTTHQFNNFWCETGNVLELTAALTKPNTVFVVREVKGKEFAEV